MQKIITLLSILLASACGPGRQAAWEKQGTDKLTTDATVAEGNVAAADALWANRSERESLERAITLYEQLATSNPTWQVLTKLSHAYYFLGDTHQRLAGETDVMLTTFEKGVEIGERALMGLSPEFASRVKAGDKVEQVVAVIPNEGQEALYWYASNLGKFAVAKGFTTTLFYKDRIFSVMQRVLAIDEKFFHGAPHRYFGAFYAKAPSFAGGDLEKAKTHFERSLELDANYLGTKVLYAEYYAPKKEDKELFTRLLNEVTAADPQILPDLVPEQKFEQEKARQLLANMNDLF